MNNIQNLTMLSAVIAFASCNTVKTESKPEVKTETVAFADSLATAEIGPETKIVEGIVQEIQNGKDGYTAKMITANKEIYFFTVSHSNLKDHSQYRTVKAGDKLKASGELFKIDGNNHLTVREIK